MGPQGPATLAEFTLVTGGADFYDISSINGVNVPVSMGPIGGAASAANPYTCGTAGAATASASLQACSWSFNPTINGADQSTLLRAVTPGGAACSSDASCGGGEVCGTALSFGGSSVTLTCGQQVGWWTADELCAYSGNSLGGDVACNQAVSGQGTNANLYGCNGANATSGYSTSASSTSCGCPEWNVNGAPLSVAPGFSCHATNPAWESIAQPWAAFLKNACPTAYSFPFDDATSTFTCATSNASGSNPNGMGYAITFCPPGGTTGLSAAGRRGSRRRFGFGLWCYKRHRMPLRLSRAALFAALSLVSGCATPAAPAASQPSERRHEPPLPPPRLTVALDGEPRDAAPTDVPPDGPSAVALMDQMQVNRTAATKASPARR